MSHFLPYERCTNLKGGDATVTYSPSYLKITPPTLRRWRRKGVRLDGIRRPPRELMCIKDIMRIMGVSRSTVLRWRKAGCPCHRIGKSVRFSLRAVRRWRGEHLGHHAS